MLGDVTCVPKCVYAILGAYTHKIAPPPLGIKPRRRHHKTHTRKTVPLLGEVSTRCGTLFLNRLQEDSSDSVQVGYDEDIPYELDWSPVDAKEQVE